ncbi:MAG: hypothetical protein IPL22_04005 [Bacteroidetes bacterium]|nr:hypothetical protein [Bacteroidota bacterium]
MKSYTQEGRKIMDAIEGFRMYLSTTEKERYLLMNPPKKLFSYTKIFAFMPSHWM